MTTHDYTLDRIDRKILAELQADGSLSNLELADRVGLSGSPCARRVKALRDAGIIGKTVTRLEPKALGLSLTALIHISMDRHTPDRFEQFEASVANYPEVQECYLITGQSADYVLKVIVRDMDAYQAFLLNQITRLEGVTGVQSSFVLRRSKDSTEVPIY
jgi:Lrp/AsnC family leucine-responsive transcriptional regulator